MNISIQDIHKSYNGIDLIAGFSLDIPSGMRLCICGPNGSGKSTFIKLLAGAESPDAGKVVIPKGGRLGYVEQEIDETKLDTVLLNFVIDVLPDWNTFWEEWEVAISSGKQEAIERLSKRQAELEQTYGYNPENRAKTVLSGLGFSEDKWTKSLRELSGGWRERAKLARVLTAGADILLLDEPTNHLDIEAVEWLESFLLDYEGVLAFVAHDKIFMDKIGTHLLYCSGLSKPLFYKGSFSKFIAAQTDLSEQRSREAERIQNEIERKMDFVRRFKAKATKARQAASRQKMAKKLEKDLEGLQPEQKRKELNFSWPEPPQAERVIMSVNNLQFSFPDGHKMWDTLNFTVYRGQKIALIGSNGCGKSTLLKIVMNKLEKNSGEITFGQHTRVGYFSQHQLETLNASGTVLGEIRRLSDPKTTEEELMSVLGLFMLNQSYFDRNVESLSGGEKSRLILATLFLARNNFLVLDEPTNHLDLESREALVSALSSFKGTLLMVAHDRHLLTEAAEQIWELSPQGLDMYEYNFSEYTAKKYASKNTFSTLTLEEKISEPKRTTGLTREEIKKNKRKKAEMRNALYKEMKPFQQAFERLEKELEELLQKQTETEFFLADPDIYADSTKAAELLKEHHKLQVLSEKLLEELAVAEEALKPYEKAKEALLDEND